MSLSSMHMYPELFWSDPLANSKQEIACIQQKPHAQVGVSLGGLAHFLLEVIALDLFLVNTIDVPVVILVHISLLNRYHSHIIR